MAVHSKQNLYLGINPHLNSFLQYEQGGWESFHAEMIVQLRMALDAELPSGYLALAEKSLQISEITPAKTTTSRTRPDVMIYQATDSPQELEPTAVATTPTATLSLVETLAVEEHLTSVVIYQAGEGSAFGRPITRIEILSPANKSGGSHYPRYMQKRLETLHSGLRLLEIDYLHETHPVISNLPSYPAGEANAYPYTIVVSDPRPEFEKGQVVIYGFGVDDPIPRVTIPLAGVDTHIFDFGIVYNQVYDSLRFVQSVVDYEAIPLNFDQYTEVDRQTIMARMETIRQSLYPEDE